MLLGLARKLGAPDGEVAEALAGRVNPSDVLSARLEAAPGWVLVLVLVLVLDNADDVALLSSAGAARDEAAGWLRPTRAGLVLVTARLTDPQAWGPLADAHRVELLADSDGGQALLDLAPGAGDDAQAAALSSLLGALPLALHQAGAYLTSPFASERRFESYGQALDQRFAQLLGVRYPGRRPRI